MFIGKHKCLGKYFFFDSRKSKTQIVAKHKYAKKTDLTKEKRFDVIFANITFMTIFQVKQVQGYK